MRNGGYLYTPPSGSARERDYALVYASLEGDQAAWEAICQESFGYVVNAARQFDYRRLFTQDDYYDIADEAFCKCYEHRSRYQGIGRFRKWVFGYAKNIMRNRGRRQLTIRKNQYLLESTLESRSYSHDPLMLLIELERDQCLWTAFYQLNEKDQEIIYRRVFFNTPLRELAGKLQLTRKQVLQRYENGLLILRWNFHRLYTAAPKIPTAVGRVQAAHDGAL